MNKIIYFAIAVPFLILSCTEKKETTDLGHRPNILLIVADDLGYTDIGSFGGEILTPTLDHLSKEGLQLTNFHTLPTCSPTRSVLLSGSDNHLAGIGTMNEVIVPNQVGKPGYEGYLNFRVVSVAELLKDAGYHTYLSGKWHLGHEEEHSPYARGFEETFTLLQGGASHWYDMKPLSIPQGATYRRNGKIVDSLPGDFYSTTYYTDLMINWIDKNKEDGKPFFGYLSYTAPHDPLHAPKEYIDKYKGMFDDGYDALREVRIQNLKKLGIIDESVIGHPRMPWAKAWNELSDEKKKQEAKHMEVFAAMIDYMDYSIGRLFDYLKEIGEYDNTMIIFFSDNGANGYTAETYPGNEDGEYLSTFDNSLENMGLPNSFIDTGPGWAYASSAPSRLYKSFITEGGILSPCIIKIPGNMPQAGSLSNSFVHVVDMMPTLLDLAEVDHPKTYEGREVLPLRGHSMLPFLKGNQGEVHSENYEVGWEFGGLKAYRQGDWKTVWLPKPVGTSEWQLYNLKDDPGEINDLAAKYPDKLTELIGLWENYAEETGVVLPEGLGVFE
jgi:arylsulfatase